VDCETTKNDFNLRGLKLGIEGVGFRINNVYEENNI
jgi:hypothetical protein